jgi:hypothetical protein
MARPTDEMIRAGLDAMVERVARAIYQAKFPTGTTWEDWEAHHKRGRRAVAFDGRDESRRLARAAIKAIGGYNDD